MKKHELKLIVNAVSEDTEVVFAGFLGHPEKPSVRLVTENFAQVYGTDFAKGDGFSILTTLEGNQLQGEVFIPMINGKPMRTTVDDKRIVVKFKTLDEAQKGLEGIGGDVQIVKSYEYLTLPDAEMVEGLRKGEAIKQSVTLDVAEVASIIL